MQGVCLLVCAHRKITFKGCIFVCLYWILWHIWHSQAKAHRWLSRRIEWHIAASANWGKSRREGQGRTEGEREYEIFCSCLLYFPKLIGKTKFFVCTKQSSIYETGKSRKWKKAQYPGKSLIFKFTIYFIGVGRQLTIKASRVLSACHWVFFRLLAATSLVLAADSTSSLKCGVFLHLYECAFDFHWKKHISYSAASNDFILLVTT